MNILFLDCETFSDVPITHGTHAYAEKAEVLIVALAWNDEEPFLITHSSGGLFLNAQSGLPDAGLHEMVEGFVALADKIVSHNSAFDRTVLRHCGVKLPVEKIEDTMVMALAHSLPGSLGQLCDILDVPTDKAKDKEGKKLIQLFTKPRPKNMKLRRATAETHPEEWQAFCAYARSDIRAMREVYKRLPRWNCTPFERRLWLLDQTINDRGIAVDVDLARAALRAADRAQGVLSARANELTGGAVGSLTQRAKFKEHLETEHAFEIDDLTKGTVSAKLKGELTDEVRELLEVRQQASMTSTAKYAVLTKATSGDGRLRGTLQFCGAGRTARWSGRLVQLQNFPRPTLKSDLIEAGIAAIKADCEDLVVGNVMELLSSAVRGVLIAPPGKKLVVADLSNIEGRVLAWLAGEEWETAAFKAFDKGVGHDLYVLTYARSFNVTPETVIDNKENGDGRMRLIGKTASLACGYGGSLGAFTKMATVFGLELPEEEVVRIVKAWRAAHPRTVSLWYDIENAVKRAIREGDRFKVQDIEIDVVDGWLRLRLPSGRWLSYPNAKINDTGSIVYDGVNQFSRKWESIETYGARLVENLSQAVARDVLAHGIIGAEAAGYDVCAHIHDEIVAETPDSSDFTAEGLSAIMSTNPSWSLGLPLAAAGFSGYRYRKG